MITFFEKPGCLSNRKQKALLAACGYELRVKDLLNHPWQRHELTSFLTDLNVEDWFNPSAPVVKSGDLDPALLNRECALDRLLAEPLLIRRPLLEIDGRRMAGFDRQRLSQLLGIELEADCEAGSAVMESCSRSHGKGSCP